MFFPSPESLRFTGMDSWEEWRTPELEENDGGGGRCIFPSLAMFQIRSNITLYTMNSKPTDLLK